MVKSKSFEFVTAATAALATGLSITAIYQHIGAKNLEATKITGFKEWMITKEALAEFVMARAHHDFTHQWRKGRKGAVMENVVGPKKLTIKAKQD